MKQATHDVASRNDRWPSVRVAARARAWSRGGGAKIDRLERAHPSRIDGGAVAAKSVSGIDYRDPEYHSSASRTPGVNVTKRGPLPSGSGPL